MEISQFNQWYKNILAPLYQEEDAGFVLLLITFPLLERYTKNVTKTYQGDMNDKCYDALTRIFPVLLNTKQSREFWEVYRHGLLHRVAFKNKAIHGGYSGIITYDVDSSIKIENNVFIVNPRMFSKKVIEIIENDFSTFNREGPSSNDSTKVFVLDIGNSTLTASGADLPFRGSSLPNNHKKK